MSSAAQIAATDTKDLTAWMIAEGAAVQLLEVVLAMSVAAVEIADAIRVAPLKGHLGAANAVNVQGEDQKLLDVMSNDITVAKLMASAHVRAMVSEEIDDVIQNPNANKDGDLAVCFDPLDGSSNIETNGVIGTIFSVLHLRDAASPVASEHILQAIGDQRAAGYFLYGPSTSLVITVGNTVAMFALDPESGQFILARENITISPSASEFAINMAHKRFWDDAVTTYIDECMVGEQGPRGKPYNMRWAGSMVADVHRLFVRGGIFIYPALSSPGGANGKLRLLYEAIPMAMLIEKAGGMAIAGDRLLSEVAADDIHQRVPLALGSKDEVAYLLAKATR